MDELNKRIIELMIRLDVSKTNFAKALDISLPTITHIANGRNKPGLDILQKILLIYTIISPDWLLLGQGEMYRKQYKSVDYTALVARIENVRESINAQQEVYKTIRNYHKILNDEVLHLKELDEMIDNMESTLQQKEEELNSIGKILLSDK